MPGPVLWAEGWAAVIPVFSTAASTGLTLQCCWGLWVCYGTAGGAGWGYCSAKGVGVVHTSTALHCTVPGPVIFLLSLWLFVRQGASDHRRSWRLLWGHQQPYGLPDYAEQVLLWQLPLGAGVPLWHQTGVLQCWVLQPEWESCTVLPGEDRTMFDRHGAQAPSWPHICT